MGKIVFEVTNFIGIKVEKLRFPPWTDIPDLRNKYSDLLPELPTILRPYFYIATSPKEEAAFIREVEGIPDLYPLQPWPARNVSGFATIINMVGLYVNELDEAGLSVEDAYSIIEQALIDTGIGFDHDDIEVLFMIPRISIIPEE